MELSIECIATFKNQPQYFFDIDLHYHDLDGDINHFLYLIDNTLNEALFDYENGTCLFDYNKQLIKLSTCIQFNNQDDAKQYSKHPIIKELLKRNGKLFFKNGELQ